MKRVACRKLLPHLLVGALLLSSGCVGYVADYHILSTSSATSSMVTEPSSATNIPTSYENVFTQGSSFNAGIILTDQSGGEGKIAAGDISTMLCLSYQALKSDNDELAKIGGDFPPAIKTDLEMYGLWYDVRAILSSTGKFSTYTQVGVGIVNSASLTGEDVGGNPVGIYETSTLPSVRALVGIDIRVGPFSVFVDVGLQLTSAPELAEDMAADFSGGEPIMISPMGAGLTWRF